MWTNSKYGKKKFKGTYEYQNYKGKDFNPLERIFILTEAPTHVRSYEKPPRRISFESWQAAKALGWVKE